MSMLFSLFFNCMGEGGEVNAGLVERHLVVGNREYQGKYNNKYQ